MNLFSSNNLVVIMVWYAMATNKKISLNRFWHVFIGNVSGVSVGVCPG